MRWDRRRKGEKRKIMTYRKYRALKTTVGGITFDSCLEAKRYTQLKILETAGAIKNLQIQPKFRLMDSFKYDGQTIRAIDYIADFMYEEDGKRIVEDVKGIRTKDYIIKSKLFIKKCILELKYVDEFREMKRGDF